MVTNSDVLIGRIFPGFISVLGVFNAHAVLFRYIEGRLFKKCEKGWELVRWYHRPRDEHDRRLHKRKY